MGPLQDFIFQTMADILRYIQTENLYLGPSEVHWPHIVCKKTNLTVICEILHGGKQY